MSWLSVTPHPWLNISQFTQVRSSTNVMNVRKPSARTLPRTHTGRSPMSVMVAGKPIPRFSTSFNTWGFTLERNLTSAVSVGKPSVGALTLLSSRKSTQARNPVSVRIVGRHSVTTHLLHSIRGFTLGKNPTPVRNAGKPSIRASFLFSIIGSIRERSPTNATMVRKPIPRSHTLFNNHKVHRGNRCYMSKECGEDFNWSSHLAEYQRHHTMHNICESFCLEDTACWSSENSCWVESLRMALVG